MEERVGKITGFILWTLSGLMSMGLYLGYAGVSWLSVTIALALSGSLEVGKILSFRKKGAQFKLLAVCLSGMTLLSILGTTLVTVDARKQNSLQTRLSALRNDRAYKDALGQQTALKAQAEDLQARIKRMPPDWVSLALKATEHLNEVNATERSVSASLTKMEADASIGSSAQEPTIFRSLGHLFGTEESKVEVVVLLALATLCEVTAFSLAGHIDPKPKTGLGWRALVWWRKPDPVGEPKATKQSATASTQSSKVTPEAYLKVALDHPKRPFLLGRGKVSEKLGITETEAKDFIEALVRDGKVKRHSKFFVAV